MSDSYPADSPQSFTKSWWVKDSEKSLVRGRLLWAFVPHVSLVPSTLVPEGRVDPTDHKTAKFVIAPLRAASPPKATTIPVAALPQFPNESYTVHRSKKRPTLVVCGGGHIVDPDLTRGAAKWQTDRTMLVAPYYGVDTDGKRSGFRGEFVDRIRRCEYRQYIWDRLPVGNVRESILRLDHIQPIGLHHDSYELTEYRLSEDAADVIDEWFQWLTYGVPVDKGLIAFMQAEFSKPPNVAGSSA